MKAVVVVTGMGPGVVASMHATACASHATTASKMQQEGPEGWKPKTTNIGERIGSDPNDWAWRVFA